jgi:Tetrapyrrole (Corrin/Porphyrin) Methylases
MEQERCLYVIGLGVKIPGHTTIEAADAMSRCGRIYSIVQEPPDLWLPGGKAGEIPVVNVLGMYVEGAMRTQNYELVASVIFGALHEVHIVGYVTYGNPLAYDSVAQKLVRDAQTAGIPVYVVPGISSVDTILCDLGTDMAPGIQIYEASWLVASRTPLNSGVATILLQLGHFGSARAHYRVRRPARSLEDLIAYLCSFYPPSHSAFLVQSSPKSQPAAIKRVRLDGLCEIREKDWAESIYIPATEPARSHAEIMTGNPEA